MTEYMENAIARTFGVKRRQVGRWSVNVGSGQFMQSSVGRLGIATILDATMDVQIAVSADMARAFHEKQFNFTGVSVTSVESTREGFDYVLNLKLVLLYGKQTQHIFKALSQQFTVRGPQKRKKRK